MFCAYCGKQISDDAAVCDGCNMPVAAKEENAQPAAETPQAETPQAETPQVEAAEPVFAQPVFEPEKKKMKKGKLIGLGIAAVAVVAIVIGLFNFEYVLATTTKWFGSDADYFKVVERNAIMGYVDTASTLYGRTVDTMDMDMSGDMDMSIQVGDDAIDLLKMAVIGSGLDMDFDFLKDIRLSGSTQIEGAKESVNMELSMGGEDILGINVVADSENVYIALPPLSDKYLEVPIATNAEFSVMMEEYAELLPELQGVLPTDSELQELLEKYLRIVIDNIDNVKVADKTVKVDGVEEDLTVITFEVTRKNVMEIAHAILVEIRADEDIKAHCEEIEKFISEQAGEDVSFYDDMIEAIDEALADYEELDLDDYDIEICTLVDYVNDSHEIVGRELVVDDEVLFYYLCAHDGSDFAFKAEIEAVGVRFTGNGEDSGSEISGDFVLAIDGEEIVELTVTDFDTASMAEGYLNGSFKIAPAGDLLKQMMGSDAGSLSMMSPALELIMEEAENQADMTINLLTGDTMWVGVSLSADSSKGGSVKLPDAADVVSAEDADDWAASLDTQKLLDALEDAGLPVDLLESLGASGITGMMGSNSLSSSYPTCELCMVEVATTSIDLLGESCAVCEDCYDEYFDALGNLDEF